MAEFANDVNGHLRRVIGVFICTSPIVLTAVSAATGAVHDQYTGMKGSGWTAASILIAFTNAYLAYVRPRLFKRSHASMEGYRNISGLPLVGTVLLIAGCLLGFGSFVTAILGLGSAVFDVGGLPWFLAVTWRDGSFWSVTRK